MCMPMSMSMPMHMCMDMHTPAELLAQGGEYADLWRAAEQGGAPGAEDVDNVVVDDECIDNVGLCGV